MKQNTIDYYKVLEVRFGADKADITSSYRRLCKLYHPDINSDPGAEDLMKEINNAYYILCDESRREAYNISYLSRAGKPRPSTGTRQRESTTEMNRAKIIIKDYFDALRLGAFEMAYELLSAYDKQFVTLESFCRWRESVKKLFLIRKYEIGTQPQATLLNLDDGKSLPARKHEIELCEKNLVTQEVVNYSMVKFTVMERGGWKVFLGYKDLNDIVRMFEKLSRDQERGEMERLWERHCAMRCRELNMFNLSGLLNESSRELYRAKRNSQELAAACLKLSVSGGGMPAPDVLERAADIFRSSLREIDITAYLGDGIFAVLLVDADWKSAPGVMERVSEKLRDDLARDGKPGVSVALAAKRYSGGNLEDYFNALHKKLKHTNRA